VPCLFNRTEVLLDSIWLLAQVDICAPLVSDIYCVLHYEIMYIAFLDDKVIFVKVIFSTTSKKSSKGNLKKM